jgi:glycosyltransferase involved in cell wall biosynthesis
MITADDNKGHRMPLKASLKIAMVAACPFPAPRGTPLRIYRLAEALTARGHEVHVIAYHIGGPSEPVPFAIHRIPNVPTYRRLGPGPTLQKLLVIDPLLTIKLLRLLKRGSFDLIHAHHYEGLLVSLPARRLTGIPIVFDMHTLLEPELPHYGLGLPARAKKRIARSLDRRLPPMADHILAVTEGIRGQLVDTFKVPGEKVTVATNGVLLSLFDDLDADVTERTNGAWRLVYAGNLASYQGIDLMLQAFRLVLDKRKDVVLRIVTEGDLGKWTGYAASLGIRESVEFHQVDFRRTVELLAASDIAINPRVECPGVPQKLLNYMAAGKAIVSFAGSAKFLEQERTGLIVEDGNVEALAGALLRLTGDAELVRRLGENAYHLVSNELSWEMSAETAEEVYRKVLSDAAAQQRK